MNVLERQLVEKSIKKRIFYFDIQPLLFLLEKIGYADEHILFKSAFTNTSQSSLIAGIKFKHGAQKQVTIYVNWGILSPQTPLPSYIFKTVGDNFGGSKAFMDFVNFFDHHLFKAFIAASYPESSHIGGVSWEDLKQSFMKLAGLKSVSTMHWAIQQIFPELDVDVKRNVINQEVYNGGIRLGHCKLGDKHSLGKSSSTPVDAFTITLFADEGRTPCMVAWPIEVLKRYERQVKPLLANMNINVEIFLIIREQNSMARLSNESYLGYDKIKGDHLNKRRILIFRGRID
ncbi:MAG: hypothetical protein MK132_07365 [Lentisphaerales bacterium]|nr:hypothetical protein [Lentisphaerales bacterium]